jgi:hypothetical protein
MFQLARRVAHSSAANQTHEVAAAAAGKRTQAETAHGPALGEPDYYNAAIDSAMRVGSGLGGLPRNSACTA